MALTMAKFDAYATGISGQDELDFDKIVSDLKHLALWDNKALKASSLKPKKIRHCGQMHWDNECPTLKSICPCKGKSATIIALAEASSSDQ